MSASLFLFYLDVKTNEEPHGLHLKAKAAARERSGQHSGEPYSRKQVLLIHPAEIP